MRVEPHLEEVVEGRRGMLRGIEAALKEECLVSAVALIFAAIDSLAALSRPIGRRHTRAAFVEWATRYLAPERSLRCTPLDLYAARCGVLHSYSAESDLENQGSARQLIYRWRSGPEADAMLPIPANSLVVEVEALHEALRSGVAQFLVDSEIDREMRTRVSHHLPSMLCYAPFPNLEVFIAA